MIDQPIADRGMDFSEAMGEFLAGKKVRRIRDRGRSYLHIAYSHPYGPQYLQRCWCGTHVTFTLADMTADDWEVVPDE